MDHFCLKIKKSSLLVEPIQTIKKLKMTLKELFFNQN